MSNPIHIRVRRGSALERLLAAEPDISVTERVHVLAERYEAVQGLLAAVARLPDAPPPPKPAPSLDEQVERILRATT